MNVYICFVCDECRFTGSIKLKGIIVIGGEEDTHPSVMKLYVITSMFIKLFFVCIQLCTVIDTTQYSSWVVQISPNKCNMADGRHVKKLQYTCNILTDFDKIWHSDMSCYSEPRQQVKFCDF